MGRKCALFLLVSVVFAALVVSAEETSTTDIGGSRLTSDIAVVLCMGLWCVIRT